MEIVTYFIGNRNLSKVKIGKTSNIQIRFIALQCGSPVELELFGVLNGDTEKQLHDMFAEHHSHGEWFLLSQDIEDFITLHAHIPKAKQRQKLSCNPFEGISYEDAVKKTPARLDSVVGFGFKRRTCRVLLMNDITSVWEIPSTDEGILMLRGGGHACLEDIRQVMAAKEKAWEQQ